MAIFSDLTLSSLFHAFCNSSWSLSMCFSYSFWVNCRVWLMDPSSCSICARRCCVRSTGGLTSGKHVSLAVTCLGGTCAGLLHCPFHERLQSQDLPVTTSLPHHSDSNDFVSCKFLQDAGLLGFPRYYITLFQYRQWFLQRLATEWWDKYVWFYLLGDAEEEAVLAAALRGSSISAPERGSATDKGSLHY